MDALIPDTIIANGYELYTASHDLLALFANSELRTLATVFIFCIWYKLCNQVFDYLLVLAGFAGLSIRLAL